jgi:hypothetical protein
MPLGLPLGLQQPGCQRYQQKCFWSAPDCWRTRAHPAPWPGAPPAGRRGDQLVGRRCHRPLAVVGRLQPPWPPQPVAQLAPRVCGATGVNRFPPPPVSAGWSQPRASAMDGSVGSHVIGRRRRAGVIWSSRALSARLPARQGFAAIGNVRRFASAVCRCAHQAWLCASGLSRDGLATLSAALDAVSCDALAYTFENGSPPVLLGSTVRLWTHWPRCGFGRSGGRCLKKRVGGKRHCKVSTVRAGVGTGGRDSEQGSGQLCAHQCPRGNHV